MRALSTLAVSLSLLVASSASNAEQPPSPFAREARRLDKAKLDALLATIGAGSSPAARAALTQLLAATAADAPLLHRALHRRTRVAPARYRLVLRRIGANVPNRHGRFAKQADKRKKRGRVDWLDAAMARGFSGRAADAARETRVSVALMRALAATGRSEAALSLLRFAYRHEGAFRDECGHLIRRMGEAAVAALVRARVLRGALAFKIRRYAAYQLDRLNRARPELALKQASLAQKIDLLHAYGEVRLGAAVSAVVAHCDHKDIDVRRAARWAALRYVTGRPPRAKRRRLRLAGGRTTQRVRTLYLTYRQLARHALADALARELTRKGGPRSGQRLETIRKMLKREVEPRTIAERLFARFDARRRTAHEARYRAAEALARSGNTAAALRAYDKLLARDAEHPQRALMAKAFVARAAKLLREGHVDEAARLATKAIYLVPAAAARARRSRAHTTVARARAIRLVAESHPSRRERVVIDAAVRLRLALKLWPAVPLARQALVRQAKLRSRRGVVAYASLGVIAVLLAGLAFWRRRQRARAARRRA